VNIAITGSKGYVGSALVKALLRTKHNLFLYDKYIWDIKDPIKKIMKGIDVVIHLAAIVAIENSYKKPHNTFKTNFEGTKNVINAFPNAKIIFASSAAVYNLTSPYAKSKKMAENLIIKKCHDYAILRFFNIGGGSPNNAKGIFLSAVKAIKKGKFIIHGDDYPTKDGTCMRDYIHLDDVICLIIKLISSPPVIEPQDILSQKQYTVLEYIECFKKINKASFEINYVSRRSGEIDKPYFPKKSYFFSPEKELNDIVLVK